MNLTEGSRFSGAFLLPGPPLAAAARGGDGEALTAWGGAGRGSQLQPLQPDALTFCEACGLLGGYLRGSWLPWSFRRWKAQRVVSGLSPFFQAFPGGLGEGMDSRQQFRLCLGAECLLPVDVSAMLAQVGQNDIRDPP